MSSGAARDGTARKWMSGMSDPEERTGSAPTDRGSDRTGLAAAPSDTPRVLDEVSEIVSIPEGGGELANLHDWPDSNAPAASGRFDAEVDM